MMERKPSPLLGDDRLVPEEQWSWKACRDIGFGVRIWPLHWLDFGLERSGDQFGMSWSLNVGPIELILAANIGDRK